MLIVVSGHSRGVGKTSLVEAIIKVSPTARFSTLKISGHHHGGTEVVRPRRENSGSRGGRLLDTGAQSAWFVGVGDDRFPLALPAIEELMSTAQNWIVESNRLIAYLRPQLLLFVCHPEIVDWKASAEACLKSCDAVVFRSAACAVVGHSLPRRFRRLFQPQPGVLEAASAHWLARRINTLAGVAGHPSSAEAADQSFVAARPCLA